MLERRRVGERWRTERWESLRFQFPNWSLQLPGSRTRATTRTASRTGARSCASSRTTRRARVRRCESTPRSPRCVRTTSGFVLSVPDGTIHARHVVVATGPFQRPRIPPLPRALRRPCCRPIRHATGARRICLTAPCSSSAAGRPAARSATNCCTPGAPCSSRSSRHRRVPRRFRDKDVYLVAGPDGPLRPDVDSFPGRQWPPSVVVTGVNGGYDVNVRQIAADGVRVLGRVVGASDGTWPSRETRTTSSTTPTRHSPASWPLPASCGREPGPGPRGGGAHRVSCPAGRGRRGRAPLTGGAKTSRRSSGRPATTTTTAGCKSPSWMPRAGRSSSAGSPRCRGSTSWACTGCTPSSPACSPVSAATRSSLRSTWSH